MSDSHQVKGGPVIWRGRKDRARGKARFSVSDQHHKAGRSTTYLVPRLVKREGRVSVYIQ